MKAASQTARRNAQLRLLRAAEASGWIEALRQDSGARRAEFVGWLKQSPLHVRELLLAMAVEQALAEVDLSELPLEPPRATTVRELWPSKSDVSVGTQAPLPPLAPYRSRSRLAAAWAVGLVALGLALSTLISLDGGWKQYRTAQGEQRTFELEDGSVISLNTDSLIALRFSDRSREVRLLEGEALFRVHHDAARPFRVYTGEALIEDIGTEFNVYNRADATVIAVLEGQIGVVPRPSASSGAIGHPPNPELAAPPHTLSARQEARIEHGGVISVRAVSNISDAVAWRQGRLVFRQRTLHSIVEEFNRYSEHKIRLAPGEAAERRYSGVFDAYDPHSLAQVLARDPELSVEFSGNEIVVRPRDAIGQ